MSLIKLIEYYTDSQTMFQCSCHTMSKGKIIKNKLSFVSCEKELLKDIDINGTCRKKTQRIMKKLKEFWQETNDNFQ
jgi:hypothetical protein